MGYIVQPDDLQSVLIPAHAAIGTGPIPYPEPEASTEVVLNAIGYGLEAVGSCLQSNVTGESRPRAFLCSPTTTAWLDNITILPIGASLTEAVDIETNGIICCAIHLVDGTTHTALLHDRRIDQSENDVINAEDVGIFLDNLATESQQADVDASGVLDPSDVVDFLTHYDNATSTFVPPNTSSLDISRFLSRLARITQKEQLPAQLIVAGQNELQSFFSVVTDMYDTDGIVLTPSIPDPISPLPPGALRFPQHTFATPFSESEFSNYDPTHGYCGPGWLPQTIPASHPFNHCCFDHDNCYGGCNGASACDSKFFSCMRSKCPSGLSIGCRINAAAYYLLVREFGFISYCASCIIYEPIYCTGQLVTVPIRVSFPLLFIPWW